MNSISCFHCGEPVLDNNPEVVKVDNEIQPVCCTGCKAVAEHILGNGLKSYYDFRTDLASKVEQDTLGDDLQVYDDKEFLSLITTNTHKNNVLNIILTVENIHCAACAWLIEQSLIGLEGIERVNVNTISQRAEINWDQDSVKLSLILSRLQSIGYPAFPFKVSDQENSLKKQDKTFIKRLGVAGLFTMQVMMIAFAMYFGAFENMESHQVGYFKWLSLLLSVPVVFYSALPFLFGCFYSIKAKKLSMDVPVATAIYGAFLASSYQLIDNGLNGAQGEVYFESICMFTFLLLIGKYLEFKAKSKAVLSNANLEKTLPITIETLDGANTKTKLLKDIKTGELVQIKAGEQIAIDGEIIKGKTSVNESILNGEFAPITKSYGDTVLAGSVNNDGLIQVKVTQVGENTTLSKITQLQAQFATHKPQYTEYADRIAHWFVLSQLILALITFVIWLYVQPEDALWISLSVLVATCPCALSLATPTAYTCIMASLQRLGFLVKNPSAFDKLNQITDVVFDKTGTLTHGEFVITDSLIFHEDKNLVKELCFTLQQRSEHPIAKAFTLTSLQLDDLTLPTIDHVEISVGQGISGIFQNKLVKIGSKQFVSVDCEETYLPNANVYMSIDDVLVAVFSVTDKVKQDAHTVINALTEAGYSVHMLTGDNSTHAENIASQLNISQVHKGASAEQKATFVKSLQQENRCVLVLGDGINDAPVLSNADISVAMGKGADITKYASDIILLKDKLNGVNQLLNAAVQTRKTIKQNLLWSIIYNIVILPVAMLGFVAPYIAVIGMSASSILVVSHSLKLLKFK